MCIEEQQARITDKYLLMVFCANAELQARKGCGGGGYAHTPIFCHDSFQEHSVCSNGADIVKQHTCSIYLYVLLRTVKRLYCHSSMRSLSMTLPHSSCATSPKGWSCYLLNNMIPL
jgi:hypothetical protein